MREGPFFPLFVDLSAKRILVVGGGAVALRKTRTILRFCRQVTVVAPEIRPEFYELREALRGRQTAAAPAGQCCKAADMSGKEGTDQPDGASAAGPSGAQEQDEKIKILVREYEPSDLEGIDLAIVATDAAGLNAEIAAQCAARGILKNVASDRALCDFYFPAVVEQEGVVIGIGSGGNPALTRKVREHLEKLQRT